VKVHALASLPHYLRHVQAIHRHLPDDIRGRVYSGASAIRPRVEPKDDIFMVGGFYDIDNVVDSRIIYVEHGAGQSYQGDPKMQRHPAYHGSTHDRRVIAYIAPNQRVADSWDRPAFAAGSPCLDALRGRQPARTTVAITFHWDCHKCPETRSARPHYIEHLGTIVTWLRDQDLHVIGHWHPRDQLGPKYWKNLGVEAIRDPDEVLARSRVLIADNTSLMYEAARLDRRILVLNAPWYRRDVHHGLRFWDHVPGQQFDDPYDLIGFDLDQYISFDPFARERARAAAYAYAGQADGREGERAARWVTQFVRAL
jgi:hypothetical protein